jgi:hypothetical protein
MEYVEGRFIWSEQGGPSVVEALQCKKGIEWGIPEACAAAHMLEILATIQGRGRERERERERGVWGDR